MSSTSSSATRKTWNACGSARSGVAPGDGRDRERDAAGHGEHRPAGELDDGDGGQRRGAGDEQRGQQVGAERRRRRRAGARPTRATAAACSWGSPSGGRCPGRDPRAWNSAGVPVAQPGHQRARVERQRGGEHDERGRPTAGRASGSEPLLGARDGGPASAPAARRVRVRRGHRSGAPRARHRPAPPPGRLGRSRRTAGTRSGQAAPLAHRRPAVTTPA